MNSMLIILSVVLTAHIFTSNPNEMNSIKDIPKRKGEKPVTGSALPHLQFSDNSTLELYNALADWLFHLDYIEERPTIISVRGARAAWIKNDYNNVNHEVLQIGREFTHIHPSTGSDHGGSLHLTLTREDCDFVIAQGWGEYHPMDKVAFPAKIHGHILIYAPRTTEELVVVKTIIRTAYNLVTNQH